MDIRNFKDNAKTAAAYLYEHGIEVPHTRLLEALSRAFGERNWSTLRSQLDKLGDVPQTDADSAPTPLWSQAQGPMTDAQFLQDGGNRCPFCGSRDIDAGDVEADGAQAWDQTECNTCGSNWSSAFRLCGYFNGSPGDRVPATCSRPGAHPVLTALTDNQAIQLTMLSDDRDEWLSYVFKAKSAAPVLLQLLEADQSADSLVDLLVLTTSDEQWAIERLLDAKVQPVCIDAGFSRGDARTSGLDTARQLHAMTVVTGIRDEVVESIVDDVKERAREYGFSYSGSQAQRLAAESAELLDLGATEAEIFEAACRLA